MSRMKATAHEDEVPVPTPPGGVQPSVASAREGLPVRWLNTDEASSYLSISRPFFCRLRERNRGPRYRKFGKLCLYDVRDLDAYMEALPVHECGHPKPARGA